jgi:hypothetical protein
MGLNVLNTGAISFKRLSGKAHTQQGFGVSEESIPSTIASNTSTVFAQKLNPIPATSGLTSLYATDGKVQKVRFEVDIIPDTLIGTNQSQGYRLKLPVGWNASGALYPKFVAGTYLYTALGKLQIVPPLYGTVKPDGSNEYDPKLLQTNGSTEIAKFDPINWILDFYNGILFVQDPPAGYDISVSRPGFVEAYLYVGKYLDQVIASGITGTSTSWSNILNKPTTFPPTLPIPFTGVTALQTTLNNYILTSQKGVANGVAPLNSSNIVPAIHLPINFKEQYVVPDKATRTSKFVPFSGTPGPGQVASFQGLRVLVINQSGCTEPPIPLLLTGSSEFVDSTGNLNWLRVNGSVAQTFIDWTDITNKPLLVNQINAGAGINVLPPGGTGFTTINVKTDGAYIDTLVPSGKLTVKDLSIDPRKLKFESGYTGVTGQYIVRGTGDTFKAVNAPFGTVSGVTAASGVTNLGTPTAPFLVAQVDAGDNTIQTTSFGLRVKNSSIGSNKLYLGSAPFQINAYTIPLNTGSTYTQATDVGHAIEKLATGLTAINLNSLTGATNIGTGVGKIVKNFTGNTIQTRSIKKGAYISVTQNATDILIGVTGISATTGTTGVIGAAEDGTYTDGLFVDFVPTTPIGTAIDRFNEVLKAIAPPPAPDLNQATGSGTFTSAKLSFGSSKSIAGFTNVGTNAGNAAVDFNGNYPISGTRIGVTNTPIAGTLNTSVVGGGGGIPFDPTAFADGDKGKLVLFRNGVFLNQIILSGTTAATSNTYFTVSAVKAVRFPSGQPLNVFTYRTGTFNIPVSAMTNGYNYIRIIHSGATFSRQTNFLEWVYDNDASNIGFLGLTGLTNITLGGSKNISGVKYHTSGTVDYQATFSNVYKNIFSNSATAIDFTGKENLGAITNMNVTGSGIIPRITSTLQTLPDLDVAALNPQNTNITILATLPINVSTLLGNVGVTGRIRSSVAVNHPFPAQSFAGGQSTLTGFLVYNVTQASNLNNENFDGETNRLEARDYSLLTYTNVNAGTYAWNSTQNLLSGNAQHNTGLLVFNGELMYPNAAYLTSTYGITTGNFAGVTNSPAGNVNYTSAAGIRDYYRLFKSANGSTQSSLTFEITHTGSASDFLTNGGTGGVPSGNNIKVEFLIMRADASIYGWANPFASTGNPFGISVTSTSQSGNLMTVTCTLSTTPRVAINDIVVMRIFTASGYTNRILNLAITNI